MTSSTTQYSPLSQPFNPFMGAALSPPFIPGVIYSPPPPLNPAALATPTPIVAPKPKLLSSQEIESRVKSLSRSSPGATTQPSASPSSSLSSSSKQATARSLTFSAAASVAAPSTTDGFASIDSADSSEPAGNSNSSSSSSSETSSVLVGVQRPGDDIIVYYEDESLVPAGYSAVDRLSGTISPFALSPAVQPESEESLPAHGRPPLLSIDSAERPLLEAPSPTRAAPTPVHALRTPPAMTTPLRSSRSPSPALCIMSPEFVPRPAQFVMQLPQDINFSNYTLWFDRPGTPGHSAMDYAASLRPLCSLCSIRSYWEWTLSLPDPVALPYRTSYHWMRENVLPLWEDEENVLGGNVAMHVRLEDSAYAFNRLTLGMMGGELSLVEPDQISGVSVSLRRGHAVLHVWNKRADLLDVDSLLAAIVAAVPEVQLVQLPFYRRHKDLVQTHEERLEQAAKARIPVNPPPLAQHSPPIAPVPTKVRPFREPVPIFRHIQQPRGGGAARSRSKRSQ